MKGAIIEMGINGLTVTEVRGFGRQHGHTEVYRGSEYSVDYLPKIHVTVIVTDEQCGEVVDAIQKCCCTNRIGDGIIYTTNIENIVRIRTNERGKVVLG